MWKAIDESTLIAYEMNGAPLPHFNGFPARLIVPGWTGTYWMKHLISDHRADQAARRLLDEAGLSHSGRHVPGGGALRLARKRHQSTPITEIVVNSLITSHADGAKMKAGKSPSAAWPGTAATASRAVEVSTDGGKTWSAATLGDDLGRYAFRPWSFELNAKRGKNTVMVNATNKIGQTQTADVAVQSGRLPQQRDAEHHAERGWGGDHAHDSHLQSWPRLIALPAAADEPRSAQAWSRPRQGGRQLRRLPQPRLHPDELAVPQCGGLERRGHQDDQGLSARRSATPTPRPSPIIWRRITGRNERDQCCCRAARP